MHDATNGPDQGTLNGWKEIAVALGRSVRTVQRWERDLGLPVHRITTPEGGQIIYSTRREIDHWRKEHAAQATSPENDVASADNGVEKESPAVTPAGIWIPRWALVTAILSMFAAATVAVVVAVRPARGVPTIFEFEGDRILAFTEGGRRLWTHSFGRPVRHPATSRRRGITADLDADGRPEVIVPIRFGAQAPVSPSSAASAESDVIVAFRVNGRVMWQVQPNVTVTDGQRDFTGPWQAQDVVAGEDGHSGRLWVAFAHNTWRPSFVLEIDRTGRSLMRYLQAGRLYSVSYWPRTTGGVLAAGGTINEYSTASLAIVNIDSAPAHSPQNVEPQLSCGDCPKGPPAAFVLFANSEVTRAIPRPYGWVTATRTDGERLRVAIDDGRGGQGTVAFLSPELRVVELDRTDHYWQLHRVLEEEGRISHSVDRCPERAQEKEVRYWSIADGWSVDSIRSATLIPGAVPRAP